MVTAVMKTKLDPYTGAQLTGPLTNAVGYFNATTCRRVVMLAACASVSQLGSDGHYEVEGVAQASTICTLAQPDTPQPSSPQTFKS